jgi:hypothetical protein
MYTITFAGLRKFNLIMGAFHAVQGVAILVLAKSFSLPLNTSFLNFNETTQKLDLVTREIGTISVPVIIASFLFLSALAHLIIATVYRKTYEENLQQGLNKPRWYEYSISAGVMMVAIAMLVGIYDISSLLMIFGFTSAMNLMGLVMEVHNQTTKKTNWLSFNIGCFLGIIPWFVIAIYFWAANVYGAGEIPTFVYWIYVSLFVFFNCFAINMYLQYKKIGKWADYIYGERVYIILSLVAKSLLAWQVFAGTLRP